MSASKDRKKFKQTKVGAFLTERAPNIVSQVGEFLPDQGALGIVKNLITSDNDIEPKDKETALKLLEQDIQEMKDVSARWDSDMKSDSWLSKNTRPLALIYLTLASTILMIIDSFHTMFDVDNAWVELLKTLLITVYGAYFAGRSIEKVRKVTK